MNMLRDAGRLAPALLLAPTLAPAAPAGQAAAGPATKGRASVTRAAFGRLPDGQAVELFTLTNAHGLEARVISYGGVAAIPCRFATAP